MTRISTMAHLMHGLMAASDRLMELMARYMAGTALGIKVQDGQLASVLGLVTATAVVGTTMASAVVSIISVTADTITSVMVAMAVTEMLAITTDITLTAAQAMVVEVTTATIQADSEMDQLRTMAKLVLEPTLQA